MMIGDADALRDLTARVQRLEEHLAARSPATRPDDPDGEATADAGRLWALAGLRDRAPDTGAVLFTGSVRLPTGEVAEWQQGLDTEALLATDWAISTEVLLALGHPVRLLLLREVLGGLRTVGELGSVEGLGTTGQLYHHLRQLVAAGWLRPAGRGRYEVPVARVVPLLVIIAAAQR